MGNTKVLALVYLWEAHSLCLGSFLNTDYMQDNQNREALYLLLSWLFCVQLFLFLNVYLVPLVFYNSNIFELVL